jgi:hypothetical protein
MRLIKGPTAVASRPAVPALTGIEGYFTNGNPGAGVPATVVPDWWLNMMQDEFLAILGAAEIAPDTAGTVNNQIIAALRAMFGGTGSLTAPGYMRLAGGLIMQWGAGVTVSDFGVEISFPIAFPTACLNVSVTDHGTTGASPGDAPWPIAGHVVDRFKMQARHQGTAAGAFYWQAIGH